MNNEENLNNEEQKEFDPMVAMYYNGEQPKEEEQNNQEEEDRLKQEEQSRLEEENKQKEQEQQEQENARIKSEQEEAEKQKQAEQEKPKKWDESLNDQAKFILDKLSKGEDKDVYELLRNKFGYENLSDEDKAITFLAEKNPHLDKEDLLFKAANEYGIGIEPLSKEDLEELTPQQQAEIRKQEIERKGLFNEAKNYFDSKATNIEIPTLPNPLDEDEGYKEYLSFKDEQKRLEEENIKQQEENAKFEQETTERVNKTALEIDALPIELKIDIDKSEFALKSDFKLDEAKQKQLAAYALEYTPTKAEVQAHQNQNGELDMKGYMTALAQRLFAPQIQKALIKQAIAQDREDFTEKTLKNSTLRNNDNQQHADVIPDFYISAMEK